MKVIPIVITVVLSVSSALHHQGLKGDAIAEVDDEIVPYRGQNHRNKTLEQLEKSPDFWKQKAFEVIADKLKATPNLNRAKNVILFLGDGMSIPTISATRMYLGGEEVQLSFEKFPYTGLSKTYCVDHQVADSACSATAYLCGVKANLGTIGVSPTVEKNNCSAMNLDQNRVYSIAQMFQLQGKRTGLVTTTRVTHASPAGVYAHVANRQWESDHNVKERGMDPQECQDIASQLIYGEVGRRLNVVLGGGRKKFLGANETEGEREDQVNFLEEYFKLRTKVTKDKSKVKVVLNRDDLLKVKDDNLDYLLGLFAPGHMSYNIERPLNEPSLSEMTEAAIRVLSNDKGYFLFVEGGRIDTAHHNTWAQKALNETAEFAEAVQRAVDLTAEEDTLIVVTSDHAHTMSYAGYAARGSDILGYGGLADDKMQYTVLSYANGPGYHPMSNDGVNRFVPDEESMHDISFRFLSTAPKKTETHGGDDVAVFARGPWSHLFTGVMEQHVLAHLMAYASCVDDDRCFLH